MMEKRAIFGCIINITQVKVVPIICTIERDDKLGRRGRDVDRTSRTVRNGGKKLTTPRRAQPSLPSQTVCARTSFKFPGALRRRLRILRDRPARTKKFRWRNRNILGSGTNEMTRPARQHRNLYEKRVVPFLGGCEF
jgi:hypothetical protein